MRNYKKHWSRNGGAERVVTRENGSLDMMELDMVTLAAGERVVYDERDTEFALIVLGGVCSVTCGEDSYTELGARKNVFDGAATALYLPRNRAFEIYTDTKADIAVCKAPAERDTKPVLIRPADVKIRDLGKDGWQRQAHFILDERVDANLLYIGEAYVDSGMWASFPPHKHDEDNMPQEAILEEIYYFEFDRPAGFGIQKVYTKDGTENETYTVENGDVVEIPRGYHPFCCAPGYNSYYLWIMAGKNRGFFMTTEDKHKWLTE